MKILAPVWQQYLNCYFIERKALSSQKISGAVISLWNANGQINTFENNKKTSRNLINLIKSKNLNYQTIWAGNYDMTYRELSVLVYCDLDCAVHLAKEVEQNALYYIYPNGTVLLQSLVSKQRAVLSQHLSQRLIRKSLPTANSAINN